MHGFPEEKSDTRRDLGIMRLGIYQHERCELKFVFTKEAED